MRSIQGSGSGNAMKYCSVKSHENSVRVVSTFLPTHFMTCSQVQEYSSSFSFLVLSELLTSAPEVMKSMHKLEFLADICYQIMLWVHLISSWILKQVLSAKPVACRYFYLRHL